MKQPDSTDKDLPHRAWNIRMALIRAFLREYETSGYRWKRPSWDRMKHPDSVDNDLTQTARNIRIALIRTTSERNIRKRLMKPYLGYHKTQGPFSYSTKHPVYQFECWLYSGSLFSIFGLSLASSTDCCPCPTGNIRHFADCLFTFSFSSSFIHSMA